MKISFLNFHPVNKRSALLLAAAPNPPTPELCNYHSVEPYTEKSLNVACHGNIGHNNEAVSNVSGDGKQFLACKPSLP